MPTSTRPRLLRDMPASARRLLIGQAFSSLGDGILMPLLFIYLYRVRDLSLPMASLVVGMAPLTSFLLTLPAGALIDRFGARRALRVAAVVQALAVALLAGVGSLPLILFAIVVKSAAEAAYWPASASMLARLAPDRERAFGLRFLSVNAGIGIGGMTAAAFADAADTRSFQLLILADALTFVVLWLCVPVEQDASPEPSPGRGKDGGDYRDILNDRRLLLLMASMAILMTVGYGQLEAGIPAFAIEAAGLADSSVGLLFTANTIVVVVVQLAVLRRLGSSNAPKALAGVAAAWALSWLVLAATLLNGVNGTFWALAVAIGSQVVFAAAETILQPVHSALINDLAPDQLRGRYNAASSLAWNAGFFAGPAIAGALLGATSPLLYLSVMVLGCAGSGALVLTLRHSIADLRAERRAAGQPAAVAPTAPAPATD